MDKNLLKERHCFRDQHPKKEDQKGSTKKKCYPQKKKVQKKKEERRRTPELAFDLEDEPRPAIIEISSGTTEIGSKNAEQTVPERRVDQFPKIEQNPGKSSKAEISTVKGAIRVFARRRCPTKWYGIDVMNATRTKEKKRLKKL